MDVLDTRTLIGIKKDLPRFTPLFLSWFFPRTITFDTKEIGFDKIKKGVKLAPFVSPMVAGKANKKEGGKQVTFMPAYVKPTDEIDPDMLIDRMPGEAMGGDLSPAQRRQFIVTELLDQQEKSIVHREEWMAVNAVVTGKVIVSGERYKTMVVDYGRSPENNVVLLGAAQWTSVDPKTYGIGDEIEDWAARSKAVIGRLVFDKKAWKLFRKFNEVKEDRDTQQRGTTSDVTLSPQLERTVQYKGMFGEYECWVYSGTYEDEDGVEQPYLPDYTMVMAPKRVDNVMAYGAIKDAKANAKGIIATSRYPKTWFTDDPSVEWMQTQSAPLPVMLEANDFVVVTVAQG